jgi:virginiamycin A acetyltransferase
MNLEYGMNYSGSERYAERFPGCEISPEAIVSDDARIYGSLRGTRLVIGPRTQVFDFAIIRAAGGMGDLVLGENVVVGPHAVLYSGNGLTIGDNSGLGAGVHVAPAHHAVSRRDVPWREQGFKPSRGGITIEEDVIVGLQCVILDGSHIERGAVIGAGSVVRGRIPAYSVWAGVPARMLRTERE